MSDETPTVDPRLDNRTGTDRPKVETFPAKPQQIDGPDLVGQAAVTEAVIKEKVEGDEPTDRKGMFSPGPHGLSEESVRQPDEVTFGTEGLTVAEEKATAETPSEGE